MKRIGIDLDGTVTDYMSAIVPILKELYGLEPNFETKAYSIEEVFGLTKETRPTGMRKTVYVEGHFFAQLPRLEQSNDLLTYNLYKELGPDLKVYFVTARSDHSVIVEDTQQWLDCNTYRYDDIFHVQDKARFCNLANIQVMIEDEVHQATALRNAGVDVILRDQPWNRHLKEDPLGPENKGRLTRVYNWREMVQTAKEYLK